MLIHGIIIRFAMQVSFRKEFFDEVKFILKYDEYVKVIRQPKSESVESRQSTTSIQSKDSFHTVVTSNLTREDKSNTAV